MKTPSEIYEKAVSYYGKIQDKVTDFTPTSIAGSLLWAFSTNLANIYEELDIVSTNSFIKTASGKYLNRLIEGTFDLARTGDTRAYGYITLYGASPIQSPDEFRLRCALYDRAKDELTFEQGAETFFSPEYQQTFILTAPLNQEYVDTDADGLPYITLIPRDNRQVYAQYFILPVVSVLKGEKSNVPEGTITSIGGNIPGVIGVMNTYNPIENISSDSEQSYAPLSTRFTNATAMRKNDEGFTISVTNAYNFSASGFIEFATNKGGVYLGRYREINAETGIKLSQGRIVQEALRIEYSQAQTKYLSFTMDNVPQIVKYDTFGIPTFYQLEAILDPSGSNPFYTTDINTYKSFFHYDPANTANRNILRSHMTSVNDPLIIRQAKTTVDRGLVFDPDSVLLEDGTISESAWISGGSDPDSDEDYRIKLRKYLASLGRSTPKALEAGAMTIPGVTYAKTLKDTYAPRGSAVLLVSGDGGTLSTADYYRVAEVLEENWKAAGINLIIKTPDKVELTLSMNVQLESNMNYEKSLMDSTIKKTLNDHILSKRPGETLTYSEITAVLKGIPGIFNVWNLYIGKRVTYANFNRLKWAYKQRNGSDELFGYYHEILSTFKAKHEVLKYCNFFYTAEGNPFTNPTPAALYHAFTLRLPDTDGVVATAGSTFTVRMGDGTVQTFLVTQADMTYWEERRNALLSCFTPDQYTQFILDYRNELFGKLTDEELASKLTKLLTEPMDMSGFHITPHAIPINYTALPVSNLKEFVPATELEVASISTIGIGKKVYPTIHIEYTTREVK
jgi:uncharacterized phage protein gp47/JayE